MDSTQQQHKEGKTEFEQDFKELNIYLDVLCKNGHDVKDAGHTWIAFSDKFRNFKERILAALPSTPPPPVRTAEEILKSKLDRKIILVNNPDYTFNKIIEAMEEYKSQFDRTQPEEREERVRIASEAWDAGFKKSGENMIDHMIEISNPAPNKEQYLSNLK